MTKISGIGTSSSSVADTDVFEKENGSGTSQKITGANLKASLVGVKSVVSPSGAVTVSFTGISGSYRHMRIIGRGRDTTSGTGTVTIGCQLNADTGAHYNFQRILGTSTTVSTQRSTGQTSFTVGEIPKAGDVSGAAGMFEILIPCYADTNLKKSIQSKYSMITDASTGLYLIDVGGYWDSAVAITQVDLIGGSWAAGSFVGLELIP